MSMTYYTDGELNTIISAVGLTVGFFRTPDDNSVTFGNMENGYKRKMDVDLSTLNGAYSGAGVIGYFDEDAMKKSREGIDVPILVEWIAEGPRNDVVLPPLCTHTAASIVGAEPAHQLSMDEQHTLFNRILGKDWKQQVEKYIVWRDRQIEKAKAKPKKA